MVEVKKLFNEEFDYENTRSIDETIDELLSNKDINDFVCENDLSPDVVKNGIIQLMDYNKDTFINKDGKKESKSLPGFVLELKYDGEKIYSEYVRINPLKGSNNLSLLYFPYSRSDASLEDFQVSTEQRRRAYSYAISFVNNFDGTDKVKGLYLSGTFRSGKTYLATAIGNKIAEKGYSVIEVFYPELSQVVKSILNGEVESNIIDLVDDLKTCDLLILDDLGGESLNSYVRDEILCVVLNYRIEKSKPVIITSNVNQAQLSNTVLRKDGSGAEQIKALRIYERIKELTKEFFLTDKFKEEIEE